MKTTCLLLSLLFSVSCVNKSAKSDVSSSNQTTSSVKDKTQKNEIVSVVWSKKPERTITVGGDNGDIRGFSSKDIQTAIEALRNIGGGTVKLQPGNYEVIAPVKLYSNISLVGSGPSTVLKKVKGVKSIMAIDAGYGELQITLADASGFKPGMGIEIFDSKHNDGWDVTTAVITAVNGNTIHFDNYLVRDYSVGDEGIVSSACSLISAVEAENVTVADLTVDGNKELNDSLNGCRGGAIYLHKVHGALVDKVIVRNYASDGISWQITENVTVRNSEIYGCANAGLHPGTGSPGTTIEGNYSHDNGNFGMFVCWRVRHGIVRNNTFVHNGGYGISTGHMDTDILYENNQISDNAIDGVIFRNEIAANAPHRSIFKNNVIENNGWKNGGYGFTFDSPAEGVILENNMIGNTKGSFTKAAVHYTKNGIPVQLTNNKLRNLPNGEMVSEK